MTLHRLARTFLLSLMLLAGPALAADPVLTARPAAEAQQAQPGLLKLRNGATAYIPPDLSGPAPLVVILHGAGGNGSGFIRRFTAEADRRGMMLLSLQSSGGTWDLVESRMPPPNSGPLMGRPGKPRFGRDVKRIDAVLADFFARAPVDPARVALLGFSDGATYALSLGAANPALFPTILAFSPGFVTTPARVDPRQRIFIAHGTADNVLSFATARDDIQGLLKSAGYSVTFRPFDGGHRIDEAALAAGWDFFLNGR